MLRSLWSGSVAFGLVNIPIKLYTAVRDQSVQLHMMSPDGSCRLRRKLYCPDTGTEYDFGETARVIEVAPHQYVLLGKDEVRRLKPEKGDTLEIIQFVLAEEIDPIYFEKTYFVGPGKGGDRAYRLL